MSLMLLHAYSVWEVLFPAGAGLETRQNCSYILWESSGFNSLSKYFDVAFKKKPLSLINNKVFLIIILAIQMGNKTNKKKSYTD